MRSEYDANQALAQTKQVAWTTPAPRRVPTPKKQPGFAARIIAILKGKS